MKLTTCLHKFFEQYLPQIKGVGPNTISAYRDTFKLFVPFAAEFLKVNTRYIKVDDISSELILAFLDHLERDRRNCVSSRNNRLAALKSLAKMIRLMYPTHQGVAEMILSLPQKRQQKPLVGFLYPEEVLKVFEAVDIRKPDGFRDYTLLNLLADSGARASEVSGVELHHFNFEQQTLIVLGKGDRYRQIDLWPKTSSLIDGYIVKYRRRPKPLYKNRLFINQRGEVLGRHGINKICRKYLAAALPPKRLLFLSPAHCFRHACAVDMVCRGFAVTDIKNRLGHDSLKSTMVYMHMDMSRRRKIQKEFIKHIQGTLKHDKQIKALIGWEKKMEVLKWLDSL